MTNHLNFEWLIKTNCILRFLGVGHLDVTQLGSSGLWSVVGLPFLSERGPQFSADLTGWAGGSIPTVSLTWPARGCRCWWEASAPHRVGLFIELLDRPHDLGLPSRTASLSRERGDLGCHIGHFNTVQLFVWVGPI